MAIKFSRKINKNWIVLGVSLVVGLIAAIAAQSFLSDKLREIEERERSRSQISLVVPKFDLEKGTPLSEENVAVRAIPREWAPSGAITPDQFSRASGAVLAHAVNSGETLMWAHLETRRAPNFSAKLAPGRRAVTVPVNSISSISGMVQPGDLIDLVVSVDREDRKVFTYTLLQSVTVMATGTFTAPGQGEEARTYNTVTLDTTPEDAKKVVAARNIAKITAFLRAPGDTDAVSMEKKEDLDLLGLVDKRPPPPPRPKPFVPQVIYGDDLADQIRMMNPETAAANANAPRSRASSEKATQQKQERGAQNDAQALVSAIEKVIGNNNRKEREAAVNTASSAAAETRATTPPPPAAAAPKNNATVRMVD